jgi:antitoxin ParD1/3/4
MKEIGMSSITISLSDPMRAWIEEQVNDGGHPDASDYVEHLLQRERERLDAKAKLQAAIDEGMASGTSPRTMPEILEDARRRVTSGRP